MGFINLIIVDVEFGIVCGVGCYFVVCEIGFVCVLVIEVNYLFEVELCVYVIVDNKFVFNDMWDEKLLVIELGELMVFDIDLFIELIVFDMVEIDVFFYVDLEVDVGLLEFDDSELVSCLGDLFVLGDYLLFCVDLCDEVSYRILFGDVLVCVVFFDNFYNIKIVGNVSGFGKVKYGEFVMGLGELL